MPSHAAKMQVKAELYSRSSGMLFRPLSLASAQSLGCKLVNEEEEEGLGRNTTPSHPSGTVSRGYGCVNVTT